MALVNQYNPVSKYETAQAVSNAAIILPSIISNSLGSASLPQPLAGGSFAIPFIVLDGQSAASLPQPEVIGSFILPSLSSVGIAVATLPQPIANGGFDLTLSVDGNLFATGLKITMDSKTNQSQINLSSNITYN